MKFRRWLIEAFPEIGISSLPIKPQEPPAFAPRQILAMLSIEQRKSLWENYLKDKRAGIDLQYALSRALKEQGEESAAKFVRELPSISYLARKLRNSFIKSDRSTNPFWV